MKIRPKRIRNLIKLDSDFSSIEGIDKFGRIVYDLTLYADIFSCLSSDVITVRVSAYRKSPISRTPIFHKTISSRDVISGLKTHFSKKKGRVKKARSNPMAVTSMDISKVISNDIAGKASLGMKQFNKLMGSHPVMMAISSADISDPIDPPNLSISTFTDISIVSNSTPRQSAIKTILRDGIDPSTIADGNFPLVSSQASMQGVQGSNYIASNTSQWSKKKIPGKKKSQSLEVAKPHSLMSMASKSTKEKTTLMSHLGKKNLTGVGSNFAEKTKIIRSMVSSKWKRLDDELVIGRRKLKGVKIIYLLFEIIDKTGAIVDTFSRELDHEAHLTEYLTPDLPPIIKVKRAIPGQNILVISQRDKVATSVEVSRRFVNPDSPTMESSYKFIGTVSITKDGGEVRLDDMVNNTRACLYRAVAVGPRGHKCPSFHGAVSKPVPISLALPVKKQDLIDPSHVSVFAETVGDLVNIRITNIPEGPVCVYVIAYDLTVDKMRRNRRIIGSDQRPTSQIRNVGSKTMSLIFKDPDVKDKHIYEYRCAMIYPGGKERTSVSNEIHEFRRNLDMERVVLSLGKPELRMDATGIVSLSFDIGARFTETGIESILEAMSSAGMKGTYLEEISSNREKFNSLLSFLVIRQESVTGATETFGNYGTGRFIDDLATRSAAGVSEMLAGRSYRYVVQLLIRDAETLFDGLVGDGISIDTQASFRKKMTKFFNPTTLREGTLPSTAASSGHTIGVRVKTPNKFYLGRTGVFQSIDVSVPRRRIKVTNLTVTPSPGKNNVIQWDITGDESRIDHFLVIGGHQSIKAPLGNVYHASDDGSYQYVDRRLSKLVGDTSYSVVPVLTNFVYGKESDSVVVRLNSSEPSFILES